MVEFKIGQWVLVVRPFGRTLCGVITGGCDVLEKARVRYYDEPTGYLGLQIPTTSSGTFPYHQLRCADAVFKLAEKHYGLSEDVS